MLDTTACCWTIHRHSLASSCLLANRSWNWNPCVLSSRCLGRGDRLNNYCLAKAWKKYTEPFYLVDYHKVFSNCIMKIGSKRLIWDPPSLLLVNKQVYSCIQLLPPLFDWSLQHTSSTLSAFLLTSLSLLYYNLFCIPAFEANLCSRVAQNTAMFSSHKKSWWRIAYLLVPARLAWCTEEPGAKQVDERAQQAGLPSLLSKQTYHLHDDPLAWLLAAGPKRTSDTPSRTFQAATEGA